MKLITKAQEEKLLTNKTDKPVVKLFDAFGQAYWLLTEIDENGVAFGLCDLGLGFPELGYVDVNELKELTLVNVPRVERDAYFTATKTLTEYLAEAKEGVRP
tara:strand:- start:65 stop:370 length:306 start_codon:yes stop_codon:yes gene_type:complete